MLRKIISMLLIVFVNLAGISHAFAGTANTNVEKELRTTAKVKESIAQFGTGEAARVKIKLKDNQKFEGYVSEINQDFFTVKSSATGETTEIPYSQVKKAKGNNLSTGAKIAIGVGVVLAVAAVILLTTKKTCANGSCF